MISDVPAVVPPGSGATIGVIGAGAAGLACAQHAAWRGAQVILFDPLGPGGQLTNAGLIDTLPGVEPVGGPDLVARIVGGFADGAVTTELDTVTSISRDGERFRLTTGGGRIVTCDAVVVATGGQPRLTGVAGEADLLHRGVSHCATCDGPLFRGRSAVVVGGGDAAAEAALELADYCSAVTILVRGPQLHAARGLVDRVRGVGNIAVLSGTEMVSVDGQDRVAGVTVNGEGGQRSLATDAVFVTVGVDVDASAFADLLNIDDDGRVVVDASLATNVAGVYAAGMARSGSSDQLAAAMGDGVAAATSALRWLGIGISSAPASTPAPSSGDNDTFADYEAFYAATLDQPFADGLPLVPPTAARIERLIAAAGDDRDRPLGQLPNGTTVTVGDASYVAVLAGCRPAHAALAITAIEAFLPGCAQRAALSGESVHAVVINGPQRKSADVNGGLGALGPGWVANATIGRAVNLFAAAHFPQTTPTGFGDPGRYSLCIGEDEENSPWTPLHAMRGFNPDDSAVTVFTATTYRQLMDRVNRDSAAMVDDLAAFIRGRALGADIRGDGPLSLLIVVGHQLRGTLADGLTKEALTEQLFVRITAPATATTNRVNVASPDDILIVAAGGMAYPTLWVMPSPLPAPPTVPVRSSMATVPA